MTWDEKQKLRISELTDSLSFTKFNMLRISVLNRIVEVSHQHSETCPTCKTHCSRLDDLIEKVPQLDDIEVRQPYEKEFNEIRAHIHKKHGFYAPHHFSSRFGLLIGLAGTSTGLLGSLLLHKTIILDFVLGGMFVGLTIGYFFGAIKDMKLRRDRRII